MPDYHEAHLTMARLLLLALLAVPACGPSAAPRPEPKPGPEPKPRKEPPTPRLAVLVVFDQLRGDYLPRWRPLFRKDGFVRVMDDGAWFSDCHYPYVNTMTGPGHASIATGALPSVHGIVANEWYVPGVGNTQYCAGSSRYEQVPPSTEKLKPGRIPTSGSPEPLLAPSLGEALKKATKGKGKVVALSLKDRSAILPAGRRVDGLAPDAVYWVDKDGRFVTSTYYRDAPHAWVKELNASGLAMSWLGKEWTRLRDDIDYDKHAGPDDCEGEGVKDLLSRTFPHRFDGGKKKEPDRADYMKQVAASPMGNDLLMACVRKAIDAEGLGSRDTPDFLSVSFSSNDLVGHAWGPDSHEVLDVTLRSDLIVRDLIGLLDEKVGKGRYVLALTSDHGICPLPESPGSKEKGAQRVMMARLMDAADALLDSRWPGPTSRERPPQWVEAMQSNMVFLDRRILSNRGVKPEEAAEVLAKWLPKQPGILAAYTHAQLSGELPKDDAVGRMIQASFHPDRVGDVFVSLKPYCLWDRYSSGTSHGTLHPYDTHVPLIVYGARVKPGERKERSSPLAAAAILAAGLKIDPPAQASARVPEGLFAAE
jgi:hypothetical protein